MKAAIIVTVLFVLSLAPCVSRTVQWASDAHGLVIIATLDSNEMSFNPYSNNGLFINQDMAIWLLKKFEYPYGRCSQVSEVLDNCSASLIGWVGNTLDMGDPEQTERGYQLLDHFIARGEDVNELTKGMAPVHEAILFRNSRYLEILLHAGANLDVKIQSPGKEYDGFDALQFLSFLESKQNSDFSQIRNVVELRITPSAAIE